MNLTYALRGDTRARTRESERANELNLPAYIGRSDVIGPSPAIVSRLRVGILSHTLLAHTKRATEPELALADVYVIKTLIDGFTTRTKNNRSTP